MYAIAVSVQYAWRKPTEISSQLSMMMWQKIRTLYISISKGRCHVLKTTAWTMSIPSTIIKPVDDKDVNSYSQINNVFTVPETIGAYENPRRRLSRRQWFLSSIMIRGTGLSTEDIRGTREDVAQAGSSTPVRKVRYKTMTKIQKRTIHSSNATTTSYFNIKRYDIQRSDVIYTTYERME
jgi:hypothetical protein